jgi:hypothetical protein
MRAGETLSEHDAENAAARTRISESSCFGKILDHDPIQSTWIMV